MSLDEEVIEVPDDIAEYCEELCYDVQKEHDGFCEGEDCIDFDCYNRCIKDMLGLEGD